MSTQLRAAAVVCALAASAASDANVFWSLTGPNDYSWRVTYMPDYDQKRAVGSGVFGLPGNGSMYCVPTSMINLGGYVARHGYPFVGPGPIYVPANTTEYNTITSNIASLGVLMSTSPSNGTYGDGWLAGSKAWFNPILFDVQMKYAAGNWAPITANIFAYGANGGITSFAYGRYTHSGNTLLTRTGGHAVTTSKVSNIGGEKEIWFRNPSASDSLHSQSTYLHQKHEVQDVSFTINGVNRVMTELITDANDGVRRIIDKVLVVYPRFGMTNNLNDSIVLTMPLSVHNPDLTPEPLTYQFPQNIADFEMEPLRESIIAILIGVVAPSQVVAVDPLTRQITPLGSVNTPGRLVISRRGLIYCYENGALVCIDRNSPPTVGPVRKPLPVGFTARAIAVDDASDHIFLLGDGSVLIAIPDNLQGDFFTIPLSGPAPTGEIDLAISPVDRSIWISSTGLDTVLQHARDPQSGRYLPAVQIDGPAVVDPRSVQIDDMGDVFFASGGQLQHWEPVARGAVGAGYQPAKNSLWAGMPVGSRVVMSRSRDNFDPATMSGPSFNNVLPESEEGIGEELVDCAGDVNFNGLINFEDLNLVVSNFNTNKPWLDGDVDGDGDIDFADLNIVLSRFNTSCD